MAVHSFAAATVLMMMVCWVVTPPVSALPSWVDISTYWEITSTEGSLVDICHSNLYNIVNIGFVGKFGNGSIPTLIPTHPSDPSHQDYTYLGREIIDCQEKGIEVFISIGGDDVNDYTLTSEDDAEEVAKYLWNAYLNGKDSSVDRPFGPKAVLDGVDFYVNPGSTSLYWDVLAKAFKSYDNEIGLSASPKCNYPYTYLDSAIQTGLFDRVYIRYIKEVSCEYDGSFDGMKSSWDEWTSADSNVNNAFVGVTADKNEEGYINPRLFIYGFLSSIIRFPKFSGLMIWYPFDTYYANTIKEWDILNTIHQNATTTTTSPSLKFTSK